ncbi:MAG: SagB/ThcOx family dehydrogenase [Armatimonadota bacterium]|nr:SagB/ThcOx family dehydrogenase [bacterium]
MIDRLLLLNCVLAILTLCCCAHASDDAKANQTTIALPSVQTDSKVTVEQAILQRRSVRTYSSEPVSLQQVSQLLWAAQGITDPATGHRTAPSAMATYPLTVYLVAANVKDLPAGIYEYIPDGHKLKSIKQGDQRTNIGSQPQMTSAPMLLVYIADYKLTGDKFGLDKAKEFACIEAGHSAQNVLLEEIAQGLIGVGMAGFDVAKTTATLGLTKGQEPLYVVSAAIKG